MRRGAASAPMIDTPSGRRVWPRMVSRITSSMRCELGDSERNLRVIRQISRDSTGAASSRIGQVGEARRLGRQGRDDRELPAFVEHREQRASCSKSRRAPHRTPASRPRSRAGTVPMPVSAVNATKPAGSRSAQRSGPARLRQRMVGAADHAVSGLPAAARSGEFVDALVAGW